MIEVNWIFASYQYSANAERGKADRERMSTFRVGVGVYSHLLAYQESPAWGVSCGTGEGAGR